jgi:hypothetical protein
MTSLPRLAGLVLFFGVVAGCVSLTRNRQTCEGQPAPPTEGISGEGQTLRLSDYRGKVVLLCFWHAG